MPHFTFTPLEVAIYTVLYALGGACLGAALYRGRLRAIEKRLNNAYETVDRLDRSWVHLQQEHQKCLRIIHEYRNFIATHLKDRS